MLKISQSTPKFRECLELFPYRIIIDFNLLSRDPTIILNIDFFKEVLYVFSKHVKYLVIDMSRFLNFEDEGNHDEYEYYQALRQTEFPILHTIEFLNFTFAGDLKDFEFLRTVSEISICSNFIIQPNEFNLQKLFMATPNVKLVAFGRLKGFTGLCFLHILDVSVIRLRNVTFTTPSYLSLCLMRQTKLKEFEFTFYPDLVSWGNMDMIEATKILPAIFSLVGKLKEIDMLKIYVEPNYSNKAIEMLRGLPKLVYLKIGYSSLFSMGPIFMVLPKLTSVKCLSIHECLICKNQNRLNHAVLTKYIKAAPQITKIKLNIMNYLSSYAMDLKTQLPYSEISVVYYKTDHVANFYVLPATPLRDSRLLL